MQPVIYHNPRCSKSRGTLALLKERGLDPDVVLYLETPPDVATLRVLLEKLGLSARDILRTREAPYAELGLGRSGATDDELLAAIAGHPVLLERPIVVFGDHARIGRPPEAVLELFA